MKMGDAIFAIAMTMTCTMCPIEDCTARYKSSMANCSSKWYDALSKLKIEDRKKLSMTHSTYGQNTKIVMTS